MKLSPAALLLLGLAAPAAPGGVAELTSRLGHANPQEREAAAWDLGALADPSAAAALFPLLRDADRGVRVTAAWAIHEIGTPETKRHVYGLLFDKDPDLARFALRCLEIRYDAGAQDLLAKTAQQHPSADLRLRAFEVLDKNFTPDMLPIFKAVAEGNDALLRVKAFPILVRRKLLAEGDDLVPVFVKFLSHPDPEVRLQAIWGLRGIDDERVMELLEQSVADKDPKVHEASLSAFAALVDRRSIRGLERMYAAASPKDRATILSGVPAERSDLMQGLYPRAQVDPAPEPRRALVRLMRFRYYPDPEFTRPWLMKGARDADTEVRRVALGGLASLPAPPVDLLAAALKDKSPEVRLEVVEALTERPDAEGSEVLAGALADAVPEVRLKAIEGASRVWGAEKRLAHLRPLTRDASPPVRALAVLKIGSGSSEEKAAAEIAHEALKDAAPEVRAAGAEAIRQMGKGEWVATLGALLDDPSPLVRLTAVEQIKLQEKKAVPYVLRALDDADVGVRRLSAQACGWFKKPPEPSFVAKLTALREDTREDYLVRAHAEMALRGWGSLPAAYVSVTDNPSGAGLPADLLPLFVFPGALPKEAAGAPNLKLLGRYEAVDPQKTPEVMKTFVVEKEASGKIFYTSWGQKAETEVSDRFWSEPEYPGTKFLGFWGRDGAYKMLSWTKAKDSESRGYFSLTLSDDGQTLTYTQGGETTRKANPVVEALKQSLPGKKNEKKLAEALARMGLTEGGPTKQSYENTYPFRRVRP